MFDRRLFERTLEDRNKTIQEAAVIIGCNVATLYRKMNGASDFNRNEIQLLCAALELSQEQLVNIFFKEKLA